MTDDAPWSMMVAGHTRMVGRWLGCLVVNDGSTHVTPQTGLGEEDHPQRKEVGAGRGDVVGLSSMGYLRFHNLRRNPLGCPPDDLVIYGWYAVS